MIYLYLIINYLVGSIPWALIIGELFYKTDVRKFGSGNLGATNAGRVLGKHVAIIVAILDAMKGFVAFIIESQFDYNLALITIFMVAIGHCYPLFAHFKGGKAVATTFGILLAISLSSWQSFIGIFLVPIITWALITKLTQYVSLASIVAILLSLIISTIVSDNMYVVITIIILWLLIVVKHKDNIRRLFNGTENKKNY